MMPISQYLCKVEIIINKEKIHEAAIQFLELVGNKKIVAFHGELGSGKTSFIHALCNVKKVKDLVSSPSFSIINEYEFIEVGEIRKIFHIDLYRLKNEEEVIRAGVEDCLYSNHICFVEWPDKAPAIFPDETIYVFLEVVDEQTRRLVIKNFN